MVLDLSNIKPTAAPPRTSLAYASADPETDMRCMFAGSRMEAPGGGAPTRTRSGEWMIRTTLDLPYSMLASLEATAGSDDIGNLIRIALAAAGHGDRDDAIGVRSDRYATDNERREALGMPLVNDGVRQAP